MQYSPKLKKAMAEIKEILDKHDINGSIILHTPGNGEHFMKINASYSCAFFEETPKGTMLRLRARLDEDFKGDRVRKRQFITDTVNCFSILTELQGMHFNATCGMLEKLEKQIEINNSQGSHTDNRTQNN